MNEDLKNEDRIQAECSTWFWNYYPSQRRMLFHVNNKAKNQIEGAKFKAMGVVKGVSDLCLICPNGGMVWIEMKTPKGSQKKEQKDFQAKVEARGHWYVIKRTFEEFQALIIQIFGNPEIQ